ncbi:DNA polymerase IV [Paenibacillus sp. 23TSA30-6]|uniref:DNA polymerase IV n=1 Tax=Paenibacillus sp. 23TSA30-6 TaxID=2546104 RepID=UPI001787B5BF|nr:DNA polymerase IV [Paenibacillus sp. 23TSA30-6]MBE0339317.1 DNA polymerase IV [Paenibacillus sp. 23TSA30-6]
MNERGKKTIFLADCQSFYTSIEKADNPEYQHKPLVVAGDPSLRSGIILAACPLAKKYGISTAERLGEAIRKCPDLTIVRPRMQHYIDVSLKITEIYNEYTDLVEVFSIDEQFLDVTGSLSLFGDPVSIASEIQQKVMSQTGVWIRIGISSNKMLAKMATDIWAKKNESGIFVLPPSDIAALLWSQPVRSMFGIGSRMERHLERLGLHSIGDIARTPLPRLQDKFRSHFGKKSDIQAEVLWRTANGLDHSPVKPETLDTPPKSIGHMMTLPRDYVQPAEVETILLELTEEVCRDSRRKGYIGSVVTVHCICSPHEAPTGFSRQMKLHDPTNRTEKIYETVKKIFYTFWNHMPVKRAGVTLSGLMDDQLYQLDFFEDQERSRALEKVTDTLKDRYGQAIIMRASSLTNAGQALERSVKIGGHYK